jgi:hypothetical protein
MAVPEKESNKIRAYGKLLDKKRLFKAVTSNIAA